VVWLALLTIRPFRGRRLVSIEAAVTCGRGVMQPLLVLAMQFSGPPSVIGCSLYTDSILWTWTVRFLYFCHCQLFRIEIDLLMLFFPYGIRACCKCKHLHGESWKSIKCIGPIGKKRGLKAHGSRSLLLVTLYPCGMSYVNQRNKQNYTVRRIAPALTWWNTVCKRLNRQYQLLAASIYHPAYIVLHEL